MFQNLFLPLNKMHLYNATLLYCIYYYYYYYYYLLDAKLNKA
jgi:hypothetical protein